VAPFAAGKQKPFSASFLALPSAEAVALDKEFQKKNDALPSAEMGTLG
jgi:hypothetical protein